MEKIKNYFKYVNQWNVMLYVLCLIQLWTGYVEGEIYHSLWGCALVWGLFMIGYNSLDRELKIMLDKAKEEMARDA